MKVSLAKALKLKNRLIAALTRTKEILKRENSRLEKSPSKVDREQLYQQLETQTRELVDLKTKLAVANVGVYGKLAEMEELKSRITFLRELSTATGEVRQPRFSHNVEPEKEVYTAYFDNEKRDAEIARLEVRIATLQDEVDEYNAVTKIEV